MWADAFVAFYFVGMGALLLAMLLNWWDRETGRRDREE